MAKKIKREGSIFRDAKASTTPLAIRPSAMSIFWEWGCGVENERIGDVSVVMIEGPIEQRSGWWDGYDSIVDRFRLACRDPETSTVVLRFDSPGGECAGCFEAVRMMREIAEASTKRVVAFADEAAYSAAYAVACVADEIYLPQSGGVGSVGVIAECLDVVGMNERLGINVELVHAGAQKIFNHPDTPITADAIASVQADVNELADLFYEVVSTARGLKTGDVEALEAATFMGEAAIAAGLADGVMGFDELLEMLAGDGSTAKKEAKAMASKVEKLSGKKNETKAIDVLAHPRVAAPDQATLAAAAAALSGDAPGPEAAKKEYHETVETKTEEGEDGSTKTTTTTKTKESETSDAPDSEAPDSDDDPESSGPATSKSAELAGVKPRAIVPVAEVPPPPARRATSADVLKKIATLTGLSSPGEQIGALVALSEKAAKAERYRQERNAIREERRGGELAALVDGAITAGTLAPAKKAWAMAQTVETVRGYLAGATPIVNTSPIRQRPEKSATREAPRPAGQGTVDAAVANVAAAMMLDPAAVQAHADELRAKGLIH